MRVIDIEAKKRESVGTKYSKLARREGNIPAVVYGGEENLHIEVASKAVKDLVYTAKLGKAAISVDGKKVEALVKKVEFHPISEEIIHMDFIELTNGKEVKAEIPVRVEGTSEGAKLGGKQLVKMRKVRATTTPEKLVEELTVDATPLKIGESIRVRDLNLEGITFSEDPANPIVSVEMARGVKKEEGAEE
jgi:large subunit ribosomal protein L25